MAVKKSKSDIKSDIDLMKFNKKVNEIIQNENLPNTEEIKKRIGLIVRTLNDYELTQNRKLYDDPQFLMDCDMFKKKNPTVSLAILILSYKRLATAEELQGVSIQSAATVRDLEHEGFIFQKKGRHSTVPDGEGGMGRFITGFDKNAKLQGNRYITCSKLNLNKVLKNQKDFLNGKKVNLEIDHRTPIEACKLNGEEIIGVSDEIIESGLFDKYFQVISKETNMRKKAICERCLRGEEIELPDCVCKEAYLQNKKPSDPCNGCFWHNYKNPLYPKQVTASNIK